MLIESILTSISSFFVHYYKYFEAALTIAIGIGVAYVFKKLLIRQFSRIMPMHIARIVTRIVYYTIIAVVILVAAGIVGVNLVGLLVAGSMTSIIIGFGLQPVLSNLFAGIFVISEKILTPGDLVEIDGDMGRVVEVSIMSTTIQRLDGVFVRFPNNKVFTSKILNYSKSPAIRLDFVVSIAYREDAEKAYRVIEQVVNAHPLVLKDPPPEIFVSNLGASGVDILVRVWVPTPVWYDVKRDLLWKIKKAISDAGIEIPFTQIDVWFRNSLRLEGLLCKNE